MVAATSATLNGRVWRGPDAAERCDAAREQLAGSLACYGPRKGLLNFRKHLAAYLTAENLARETVSALCRMDAPADLDAAWRAGAHGVAAIRGAWRSRHDNS